MVFNLFYLDDVFILQDAFNKLIT